jgi:hypothetical protein
VKGRGVEKNVYEAARWFRRSAEQGDSDAQLQLGILYSSNTGIRVDYAESAKWFLASAKQGNGYAQLFIGLCYEKGAGVNRDKDEAIYWYQKAAAQGHREASEGIERCKNPFVRFADFVDSAFKSAAEGAENLWNGLPPEVKEGIIKGAVKGFMQGLMEEK